MKKSINSLFNKDKIITDPRVAGTKYSRAGWAVFMNANAINVTISPMPYAVLVIESNKLLRTSKSTD